MNIFSYIRHMMSNTTGVLMWAKSIKVNEVVGGAYCVTHEDGEGLHDEIARKLSEKDQVTLDFSGTEIFASPFFRAAFGELLKELGKDQFLRKVTVKNLQDSGKKLFNQLIENIEKTSSDPVYQKKLNDILFEELAEI